MGPSGFRSVRSAPAARGQGDPRVSRWVVQTGGSSVKPEKEAARTPSNNDTYCRCMEIREPVLGDAEGLGVVHVRAWQKGYTNGLIPQDYLDGLDPSERAAMWTEALGRPSRGDLAARFICDDDGVILGFILVGPEAGADDATRGEVYALNTHPDRWGEGVGSTLLRRGTEFLAAHFDEAVLWTHRDSVRSRGFYETNGWAFSGDERTVEVLGAEVPEVQYSRSL